MSDPVKCIQNHETAIRAKWTAFLLTRLKNVDLKKVHHTRNGYAVALQELVDQLPALCYANTPAGTIEEAGALLGEMSLNIYYPYEAIYPHCGGDEKRWYGFLYPLGDLGLHHIQNLSADSFAKFNFTWQEREQIRLAATHYRPLPWAKTLKPIEGHFAHLSVKDENLIAYTETAEKGARDIQKQIKPGRYLKEFYPKLSDSEIADLQATVGNANEVKFATDPDEIEMVYTKGPGSCMAGDYTVKFSRAHVAAHPSRAYGNGDLAVAYLTDKSGRPNARAVVWPEKKVYCIAYGDGRLIKRLATLGYKQSNNYPFQGAKMRRHPNKNQPDSILAPYFDGHGRYSLLNDDFVMVDKNGPLSGSSGFMVIPTPVACACGCGKKALPAQMGNVIPKGKALISPVRWISTCITRELKANTIVQCRASSSFIHTDDSISVYWDGAYSTSPIHKVYRQSHCVRYANGEWRRKNAYTYVALENGELWSETNLQKSKAHRRNELGIWEVIPEAQRPQKELQLERAVA